MEVLFELLLETVGEFIFDVGFENTLKIPKYIRYPILIFLVVFLLALGTALLVLSISLYHKERIASIFAGLISFMVYFFCFYKLRKFFHHHKKTSM